jgi:hypothetical protein
MFIMAVAKSFEPQQTQQRISDITDKKLVAGPGRCYVNKPDFEASFRKYLLGSNRR